jgi:large subunit ribosomal protein L31
MKEDIHPKYYPEAVVRCACGNTWTTGSTAPEVRTDICSNCHPFFTGEQRIVDSEGRVDRFYRRLRQAQLAQEGGETEEAEEQEPQAEEVE